MSNNKRIKVVLEAPEGFLYVNRTSRVAGGMVVTSQRFAYLWELLPIAEAKALEKVWREEDEASASKD